MDKPEKLNNRDVVWPDFKLIPRDKNLVEFITNIRKKHTDGKWYLCHVMEGFETGMYGIVPYDCYSRFVKFVYVNQTLGLVNTDMKTSEGESLHILDANQEEEIDRLTNLINKFR